MFNIQNVVVFVDFYTHTRLLGTSYMFTCSYITAGVIIACVNYVN